MNSAKESALIAIQYLFATQSCFSTNSSQKTSALFAINFSNKTIQTDVFTDEGVCFGLNLEYFSIDVLHPELGEMASYPLSNANHLEIINWVNREKYLLGIEADFEFKIISAAIEGVFDDRFHHNKIAMQDLEPLFNAFTRLNHFTQDLQGVFDQMSSMKIDATNLDAVLLAKIDNQSFEIRFTVAEANQLKLLLSNSATEITQEYGVFSFDNFEKIALEVKAYVSEHILMRS